MQKIIIATLLAVFIFTGVPAALGAHADLNGVYGLEVTVKEGIGEPGHPATGGRSAVLELKWKADVGLGESFRADTIDIYRTESGLEDVPEGPLNENSDRVKIGEINVENDRYMPEETMFNEREKTSVITYTDTVSADRKYRYAVSYGNLRGQYSMSDIKTVYSEETYKEKEEEGFNTELEQYENNAGWAERLVANIIIAVPNFFIDVIGMEDPVALIFGVEDNTQKSNKIVVDNSGYSPISEGDKYLHTFSQDQFSAVVKYYERLSEFVPVSMVVIVVLLGLGLFLTSANPDSRLTFKDYVIGLLIAGLVLKAGIYIISVIFDINHAVVEYFRYAVADKLSTSFLDTLIMADSLTLGSAIVTCLAVFSVAILNWQYAVRQIVLGLLIGILPLITIFSIIPSRRTALGYWFREFFSQVFMQASHAAVLSIGILVLAETNNFWIKLACIMGLPVIAGLLRKIFDAEGTGSGAAGAIGSTLGVGSLLSVARMAKPGAKSASKSVTAATTAGSAGTSTGVIGKGMKAAGGTAAGMVSGLTAGAITGQPSMGIAGTVAGARLGSGVGERVKEAGQSGRKLFLGSGEEKEEITGAGDAAQLDDPRQAYAGGKHALGGGVLGTAAGTAYAAGKTVKSLRNKTGRETAKSVSQKVRDAQSRIPAAQQKVEDYKPSLEAAKASYDRNRSLYSEDSAYMQDLKRKHKKFAPKYERAQQDYLKEADRWNRYFEPRAEKGDTSGDVIEARESLNRKEKKLNAVRKGYKALENRIDEGRQNLKSSRKDYETKKAEYSRRQYELQNLQVKTSREGIKEEFNKAKQRGRQPGGGIDEEASWR